MYETGVSHDESFARAMGAKNWIGADWARDGFEPLDVFGVHVLTDELTKADAPVYLVSTSMMVARVIKAVGSDELQASVLPGVLRGEVTIALGMSEPEAGSDVAAVTTRARPAEGGWVIDGQKMFTTNGHIADYVFLLARTDPESERHRGLTTFLVPLHTDGFEAQGVFTVSGERTNITFYGDMFLEDRWRISEVGAGWSSLLLALQDEHSAPFSSHLDRLLEHAEAWASEPGPDGTAPVEREEVQRQLIRVCRRPRGVPVARGAQHVDGIDRRGSHGRGPDEQALQYGKRGAPRRVAHRARWGPMPCAAVSTPPRSKAVSLSTRCATRWG